MNLRTKIKNETYKLHHQLDWAWGDGASLTGLARLVLMGWMKSMANGTAFACGWFVACYSGLCRGSEEGDICWFVGMVGMVGFDSLDALSCV